MPTPSRHATDGQWQSAYRQRQKPARPKEMAAQGLPAFAPMASMPSTARWNTVRAQAEEIQQKIDQAAEALGAVRDIP